MEDVSGFYEKVFGKESSLFIGTLWLGMIAKHMDDVRKAEDNAYEFMGENIFKWLNKLRTLYDNVEFKTDIPRYKDLKVKFKSLEFDQILQKYIEVEKEILKSEKFIMWFEKIKKLMEITRRLSSDSQTKIRLIKEHNILLEIGDCQREFYMEIEKKHLIMPPERESMKELTKSEWIDRSKPKINKGKLI